MQLTNKIVIYSCQRIDYFLIFCDFSLQSVASVPERIQAFFIVVNKGMLYFFEILFFLKNPWSAG